MWQRLLHSSSPPSQRSRLSFKDVQRLTSAHNHTGKANVCSKQVRKFKTTQSFLECFLVTTETHRVDSRVWVYLQRVNVVAGVLEEAVVRVQHLMGQQIEPLPAQRTSQTETPVSSGHLNRDAEVMLWLLH